MAMTTEGKGKRENTWEALLSFLESNRSLSLRVMLVLQSHRRALLWNKTDVSRGPSTASGQERQHRSPQGPPHL